MGKTKTETAEFKTKKSLRDITQIIRQMASQFKANVQPLNDDDPLGGFDEHADLEVVLSGNIGYFEAYKHFRMGAANDIWAVQVYVTDMGDQRDVQLIAMGESNLLGYAGALNLGASRDRMEKLINALR